MPDEMKPPSAASRLLSWIRDPHSPQILGDLSEEYGERAHSLGAAAARRWYWRETVRNAAVLLWRKRIIGTAFIAFLAVVSVQILFGILAEISWHLWIEAVMWKSQYRPLLYRQSWGMGWPMGFAFEVLCAPLVGLAVGYVFGVAAPDRAKHLRIAAVVLWCSNIALYALWMFGAVPLFIQAPRHGGYLLLEYVAREAVAAGAFFIGVGIGQRKAVVQEAAE